MLKLCFRSLTGFVDQFFRAGVKRIEQGRQKYDGQYHHSPEQQFSRYVLF